MGEGEEFVEGVGCGVVGLFPVAVGSGGCGFQGGGMAGWRSGFGESGEVGGGGCEESDFAVGEGGQEEGGVGKGRFEEAGFGIYDEFLMGKRDGEGGGNVSGEVGYGG